MRSVSSKNLFEYWDRLRKGRRAPERGEIEPSDIRELLGDTFILEINNSLKSISYRLAGTRLCGVYGKELKGYGYLGVWNEEHNLTIIRCVNKAYLDYTPVVISHTGKTNQGREVNLETLLLPLLPTADGSARILGVSSVVGDAPFWLGTEPIVSNAVLRARDITVTNLIDMNEVNLAPDMDDLDLPADEIRARSSKSRVSHLRIIDGGRVD